MRRLGWGTPRRRDKKEERPPAWTTKDWVTLCLALWGASLSSVLAYNTLLTIDDVRVEFDHQFMVQYYKGNVTIPNGMSVVFINAGSRPAAVRRANMYLGPDCHGAMLEAQLEPFVLKEKDIVLKELKFSPDKRMTQTVELTLTEKDITYPLAQPTKPTEIGACMTFEVSTPSFPSMGGLGVPSHKIASVTVGLPNETRYKLAEGPPLVLIRHSRLSLWED
jgi:hypothetical protein